MSAVAGFCRLDGGPATPSALDSMLASMAHRQPDAVGAFTSGSAGLGSLSLHIRAQDSAQPIDVAMGGLRIVFDGRVDNRAELASALGAAGDAWSDAELALRAFDRWSYDAFPRLVGDFALAIWDESERRLLLVRDVLGLRPLFYRHDGATIAFATEPCALVEAPFARPRLNEGMIGEHLAGVVTSATDSLFEGVHRLPGAHLLEADARGIRVRRYWNFDPEPPGCGSQDECDEQLRALLREAVSCRLRGGPASIMLSGGLDSSSITSVAARLADEGAVAPPTLLSIVFPGEPFDESPWIQAVVDRWRLPHRAFAPRAPAVSPMCEARRTRDLPEEPNGGVSAELKRAAHASGTRILLTGIGGDEWFGGSYARYADLLKQGRVAACVTSIRRDAASPQFPGYRSALRQALWPLLPAVVRAPVRSLVRGDGVPAWIDAAFARRIALSDRLRAGPPPAPPFPTLAQREIVREATAGAAMYSYEMHDRATAAFGLEDRHPFQDRRLIEFALSLPEEERWADGRPKAILRRAMGDDLPPIVRDRVEQFDYSHLVADALDALGARSLLTALEVARRGWVDGPSVLAAYDRMATRRGIGEWPFIRDATLVWNVMAVEFWIRALEDVPGAQPGRERVAPCR